MDFKIFSFSLSCILSRTYMCNVCAYVRIKFAAAKVRKNFDIYKCICRKMRFFLNFVRDLLCFGEYRLVKGENYSDDKSIILIINFQT